MSAPLRCALRIKVVSDSKGDLGVGRFYPPEAWNLVRRPWKARIRIQGVISWGISWDSSTPDLGSDSLISSPPCKILNKTTTCPIVYADT